MSSAFNELADYADTLPNSRMRTSHDAAGAIRVVCQLVGARKVLDIGTFTGCSAIVAAEQVSDSGKVITCDKDATHQEVFEKVFAAAGLDQVIDFVNKPAMEVIDELLASEETGTFDVVFLDADKHNYQSYFDKCLDLVRTGGAVIVDDTLWMGKVVEESDTEDTRLAAMLEFNEKMSNDTRVTNLVLPIGNGVTIAVKQPVSG